jgi:hypothetical protein
VSYNYRQVLGVLLSFAVNRSRVFPSLDTIARMAMCSKSTVLRALVWLSLYGFLEKLRRIVRTSGLLGPRVRQTSNAYVLRFPKGLGGLAVNVFGFGPGCNNCTPSESKREVKKGFQGSEFDLGLNEIMRPLGQYRAAGRVVDADDVAATGLRLLDGAVERRDNGPAATCGGGVK